MAPVALLLDTRGALATLRRLLPPRRTAVLACRSAEALGRALGTRVVDGFVVGTRVARRAELGALRARFPRIPLFVYGGVRSEDAAELAACYEDLGATAVLVEGVDDAAVGDVIGRGTVTSRRMADLRELPRVLRLTEPLQLKAFHALQLRAGPPPTTASLAIELEVSREHLSRQFGAGGAPNLKRVIDLIQVFTARDLLQNPGYSMPVAARALGYSTPSHLSAVTRRVVGLPARDLGRTPNADLIRRFVALGARSRS
jgi:AraC-like DNA-binding protein